LVPPEVTTFYNELTEDDKKILKEVAEKHSEYATDEDALNALKEKSEKLYTKVALKMKNKFKFNNFRQTSFAIWSKTELANSTLRQRHSSTP